MASFILGVFWKGGRLNEYIQDKVVSKVFHDLQMLSR